MYKLSPSDFAFLYEECKLCYCLKVKHGIYQPSMPMPGVFSAINTRIQGGLVGRSFSDLAKGLPSGKIIRQEGWVESKVIPNTSVYIKGKYDLLVRNTEKSYTLVDLKISQPREEKIDKYKFQLAAYKFALENPKSADAIKITRMGLLIFYPDNVAFENGVARLDFPPRWLEIPIDEKGFLKFMKEIDNLLINPLPKESKTCKWCQYRHVGEELTHDIVSKQTEIPF